MSRKSKTTKRELSPDVKFNSIQISKMINYIMEGGKKQLATKIVYGSFDLIKERTKEDPKEVFEKALKNTMPYLEVKSKRVGGANYQVPMEVRGERRLTLSLKWILIAARSRKNKSMAEKLAEELIDASTGLGSAVKKKQDTQRMAEANRAFAHFA